MFKNYHYTKHLLNYWLYSLFVSVLNRLVSSCICVCVCVSGGVRQGHICIRDRFVEILPLR